MSTAYIMDGSHSKERVTNNMGYEDTVHLFCFLILSILGNHRYENK